MTLRRIISLTALLGFVVLWAMFLRPAALGGPTTFVIVSGTSMEPTLHGGDLVATRARGTYELGDVVAFRVPEGGPGAGDLVIHRLTGGTPEGGFTTRGDNRDRPDDWRPTQGDVVGSEWFSVPGAGSWLARLRDPALLAALAGGVTVAVVVMREPRRPQDSDEADTCDDPGAGGDSYGGEDPAEGEEHAEPGVEESGLATLRLLPGMER